MSDLTIAGCGRLFGWDIPALIDELAEAARTGDEDRVRVLGGFGGQLHNLIGELLIGAVARGRTMTDDEFTVAFSDPVSH